MTGFTFLSRLTQIAPPYTRFVFLGAGFRLGLPSHPASRRRSCLRLGVSTTSSSRGLSPPSDRPCRAYSRRRLRRRVRRSPRRALPGEARPARPRRPEPIAALTNSHQRQAGTTVFLALDCPARGHHVQGGPAGRRTRSATPTLDPAATHLVLAPTRKAGTEQLIGDIQPTIS